MSKNLLKVQVTILCKTSERHFWINPNLHDAIVTMLTKSQKAKIQVDLYNARNFETSQVARNWASYEFLRSKNDYLLMIDNDTDPLQLPMYTGHKDPILVDLLGLPQLQCDIVGAPVPTISNRHQRWHLNAYFATKKRTLFRSLTLEELKKAERMPDQLMPVDAHGSGVICIRRDVIQDMKELNRRLGYFDKQKLPVIWRRPRDLAGNSLEGEDLLFTYTAKTSLDYIVQTCMKFMCGHLHSIDLGMIPTFIRSIEEGEPAEA